MSLTTFGPIEDQVRQQIKNCQRVEDGAPAVLCGDSHLGYSMPIGGVVGYEGLVSPSAVGFDIACFSGDTMVPLLDGTSVALVDLAGRDDFYVFSCEPSGRVVPAKASCALTRRDVETCDVELDNGAVVRCTPDHLFMLRDGSYAQAQALVYGQSLMPLYVTSDKDGYVLVRNNSTGRLVRAHWLVYHVGLTQVAPELPSGEELVIHHVDFNPKNNHPINLRPMGKTAHDVFHAACRDRAHFNTPSFTAARIDGIRAFWEKARTDQSFMAVRRANARSNGRSGTPEQRRARSASNGARGRQYLVRYNTAPETIQRNRERAGTPHPCPICGDAQKATSSLYFHTKTAHQEIANNHKVVSVKRAASREDVYCLTVPGVNNFAIDAGVFVHNCGNCAVRTDMPAAAVNRDHVMDEIFRVLSFGMGRKNNDRVEHPVLDEIAECRHPFQRNHAQLAANQLGTIGSGNHYVDLFEEAETGLLWIGVHFGSRGFGHKTATWALESVGSMDNSMMAAPVVIDANSELGVLYIDAMERAGRYAYAGRDWVIDRVLSLVGASATLRIHNHHNFAWRESHGGRDLWVHRKGATPAVPGQMGFVGGTMGDNAVILEGVESDLSKAALYSTVHGAGRVMSRTKAAGKTKRMKTWSCGQRECAASFPMREYSRGQSGSLPVCPTCGIGKLRPHTEFVQVSAGLIDFAAVQRDLGAKGIALRGAGADEAPAAYKRLDEVLAFHEGTIRVLHVLSPIGVAMAGADVQDEFRD